MCNTNLNLINRKISELRYISELLVSLPSFLEQVFELLPSLSHGCSLELVHRKLLIGSNFDGTCTTSRVVQVVKKVVLCKVPMLCRYDQGRLFEFVSSSCEVLLAMEPRSPSLTLTVWPEPCAAGGETDPRYMSRKNRKFRTDKFDAWNKLQFLVACSSYTQLVPSRMPELHDSKLRFVSRSRIYPFATFEFFCSCIRGHWFGDLRRAPGMARKHIYRGESPKPAIIAHNA